MTYDSVLDIGGVESHILSILRNRDSSRFSYIIFSAASERFMTKAGALGVEIITQQRRHPLNPVTPIILARQLKQKKIDLLHAHSPTSALWGRIAGRILKIPSLVTVHLPVDQYHGSRKSLRARSGRRFFIRADRWLNFQPTFTRRMVYVSSRAKERAINSGHAPNDITTFIPNGIDLHPYHEINREDARKHFNLPTNAKVITFVGRLDEQKGVDLLIEALAQLAQTRNDFSVWLVGDGGLREALYTRVHQLDLDEAVRFWGNQENIPLFLMASNIFVLPSRFEGMSIALLNGLAAGVPAIVSRVGDNDLVVTHGKNGLVISPDDVIGLTEALDILLSDPNLRMSLSKTSETNDQLISDETMVKQLELVYNECLEMD